MLEADLDSGALNRHSNFVSSYRLMIKLPQLGSFDHISTVEEIAFLRS